MAPHYTTGAGASTRARAGLRPRGRGRWRPTVECGMHRAQRAIPCLFMRGGTSRGPFFQRADLPADTATRDRVLLAVMGSPDKRQIDGLGGAHPLTSKVAIVSRSESPGVD